MRESSIHTRSHVNEDFSSSEKLAQISGLYFALSVGLVPSNALITRAAEASSGVGLADL